MLSLQSCHYNLAIVVVRHNGDASSSLCGRALPVTLGLLGDFEGVRAERRIQRSPMYPKQAELAGPRQLNDATLIRDGRNDPMASEHKDECAGRV